MINVFNMRQRLCVLAFFLSLLSAGVTASLWQKEKARAGYALAELSAARSQIQQQQQKLQRAAALDEKYTRSLQNAENTIADLRGRIESGHERLRVAAVCPRTLPASASPTGVDDAASPGLTRRAQQDYFTLRHHIARTGQMIQGLQQYVKEQCLP